MGMRSSLHFLLDTKPRPGSKYMQINYKFVHALWERKYELWPGLLRQLVSLCVITLYQPMTAKAVMRLSAS